MKKYVALKERKTNCVPSVLLSPLRTTVGWDLRSGWDRGLRNNYVEGGSAGFIFLPVFVNSNDPV